jgi:hypothetical protein
MQIELAERDFEVLEFDELKDSTVRVVFHACGEQQHAPPARVILHSDDGVILGDGKLLELVQTKQHQAGALGCGMATLFLTPEEISSSAKAFKDGR